MKLLVLTVALTGSFIVIFSAAHAQTAGQRYGEEYQKCNNGTASDTVRCVDALVRQWDVRLNEAYKKLMKQIPDAKRRTELRKTQELWIKYRQANCSWYATGEGTISRIEGVECMRSMTADRALQLEEAGETH